MDLLNVNSYVEDKYTKDTHVDLAMDMWITHNKTKLNVAAGGCRYPTTDIPYSVLEKRSAKCLVRSIPIMHRE